MGAAVARLSSPVRAINRTRALLFRIAFPVWTGFVAFVTLPALLGPMSWSVAVQRFWARSSLILLRVLAGVRHEVRGFERRPDGPIIIAAKHQSAWDTIVFLIDETAPAFVLKKELLRIPIYGHFCRRSGMVPIDRAGGPRALRTLITEARDRLAHGRPLIIFPEGTRVPVDDHKGYQPGVAGLYKHMGVPVVPVALNSGLVWPKSGFKQTNFTITLEYLDPIPPGLPKKEFNTLLERRIEDATDRLVAEGRKHLSPTRPDT